MKYIVMECHASYAVVLSEDGRFLKAANLRYEVGQTVTRIIEMMDVPIEETVRNDVIPVERKNGNKVLNLAGKKGRRIMTGLAVAAACLMVAATSVFTWNQQTFGSVYMTINPEVRIDVNRKNVVVGVDGLNEDGDRLVEGYSYKKKMLDPVMDELVDRAIEQGYLHEGGQITLDLEAEDNQWVESKSEELKVHLDQYLTEKISVSIQVEPVAGTVENAPITPESKSGEIISLTPEQEKEEFYHESDYGETMEVIVIPLDDVEGSPYGADDDDDNEYGGSAYQKSDNDSEHSFDNGDLNDGDSGYDDTGEEDMGDSDYNETEEEAGDSGYDETEEEAGDSGYDETEEEAGDSGYDETEEETGDSDYDETEEEAGDSGYSEDEEDDSDDSDEEDE